MQIIQDNIASENCNLYPHSLYEYSFLDGVKVYKVQKNQNIGYLLL